MDSQQSKLKADNYFVFFFSFLIRFRSLEPDSSVKIKRFIILENKAHYLVIIEMKFTWNDRFNQSGKEFPLFTLLILFGFPVGLLVFQKRQSVVFEDDAAKHVGKQSSFFLNKLIRDDLTSFGIARAPQSIKSSRAVFRSGQSKITSL